MAFAIPTEYLVIGGIILVVIVSFAVVKRGSNAFGVERDEVNTEKRFHKGLFGERRKLSEQNRNILNSRQQEIQEMQFERNADNYLIALRNQILNVQRYAQTNPFAARSYAKKLVPYLDIVIRNVDSDLKLLKQHQTSIKKAQIANNQMKKDTNWNNKLVKRIISDLRRAERAKE